MKKLLFVAIVCLCSIIVCNAAEEIKSKVAHLYMRGGCGICGALMRIGDSVQFPSPQSDFVHINCFVFIENSFKTVDTMVGNNLPSDGYLSFVFQSKVIRRIVRRVQKETVPQTIFAYAQQEGIDRLKELFDRYAKYLSLSGPRRLKNV